jgi:fatty-acyl-CoA synthase
VDPVSGPTQRSVDERLFGAHITRVAADDPRRQALAFGDRAWTYAELDRAIGVMAAGLAAADVKPGDVVLMAGSARPEALCILFALARLGAVAVPVHPASTGAEISSVAAAVAPVAVIGDADFLRRAEVEGPRFNWDAGLPGTRAVRPDADLAPLDEWRSSPHQPALVAFTSGTSGRPKGVVLTHENLYWSTRNALERLPLGCEDTVLVATPLAHAAVFSGLAQHSWAVGGRVVLAPRFDPDLFLDAVHRYGVTTAFTVGVMLTRLLRSSRWTTVAGSSLRWLLVGGGPPVEAHTLALADAGITAINSYGLTEAGGGVTYARPEEVTDQPLSAGPAVSHVELRIVEFDGDPARPGVAGEIWLRGPSVAREYVMPDGTCALATDEKGWLHTGDRGHLDQAGRLFVSGRVKDTIITGGENVDPAEVEDALVTMPGVREVAVVGLSDPVWGEIVAAVLVLEPGTSAGLHEVREHLRSRLAGYKIPRRVIVADALPRTATGKLRRGVILRTVADAPGGPHGAERT